MTLPLYKILHNAPPNHKQISDKGHKGLWFERFYDAYPDIDKISSQNDTVATESTWLAHFKGSAGDNLALEAKALQQMKLCEKLQGNSLFAKTQWHFATGMGLPHPIENGMVWHPTLGVPYLSGAAVKGMVRAWLEVWDIDEDVIQQKQRLQQWFGSDDKDGKTTQAGSLIFFDALPITSPTLGIDIMTPHMGDWYAKGQEIGEVSKESKKLPADWHDPVPIKFLVVKQASFQFCIAPRNNKCAKTIDMASIMQALKDALEWMGAGAKTAVGYGCFVEDTRQKKNIAEIKEKQEEDELKRKKLEEARKTMSPLAYEFYQQERLSHWQNDKDAFWQQGVMEEWLDKLAAEPNPELQERIEALMNKHFKQIMDNPDAVKGRKNKAVYKPRPRKIAKRLIQLR